jgi:hypothetical protein
MLLRLLVMLAYPLALLGERPDGAGSFSSEGRDWRLPVRSRSGAPPSTPRAMVKPIHHRDDMTDALKYVIGPIGSMAKNISAHRKEIEKLLGEGLGSIITTDPSIEDPATFVLESHLEHFLVQNWAQTELGKKYDIFEGDEGEKVGQQYPTDTGPMDILAIRKDKKELLILELKKGRASPFPW